MYLVHLVIPYQRHILNESTTCTIWIEFLSNFSFEWNCFYPLALSSPLSSYHFTRITIYLMIKLLTHEWAQAGEKNKSFPTILLTSHWGRIFSEFIIKIWLQGTFLKKENKKLWQLTRWDISLLWYSEKVNDRQYIFMICGFFEAFLYVEQ